MDLPARDNVIINATMLGLSPREARRRVDTVVDFAELGQFVDLKLKNYSSGMLVRLAFAVMIQVDADILLIDEVLAVGDAAFQQKCFDEFVRIREAGKTILLVTHDMGAVHRFCDRAMLLERGRVVEIGDPDDVGNRYLELNFSEAARNDAAAEKDLGSTERMGDGTAEIVDAWFEDEAGERAGTVPVRRPHDVRRPRALPCRRRGSAVRRRAPERPARDRCSPPRTCGRTRTPAASPPAARSSYRVRFDNLLVPGRYHATPAVARQGGGIAWIDRRERMLSLLVSGQSRTDAVVDLPYEVEVAPAPRGGALVSAVDRSTARSARRSRARPRSAATRAASGTWRARWRSATSSCASSAPRSATCGSSSGR